MHKACGIIRRWSSKCQKYNMCNALQHVLQFSATHLQHTTTQGVWNNRQVAVKRLKVQYVEGGEEHAEEFKREVELLSNLRHRNIVQYIGASLQVLVYVYVCVCVCVCVCAYT